MSNSTMATIDLEAYREREAAGLITCREHPTAHLLIWNYTPMCAFTNAWDEVTMAARGLITTSWGAVWARPFPKFFNLGDEHTGPLPLEPFTVTEKMDGSLGILYWPGSHELPAIATRGSFTSEQAEVATRILRERYAGFDFWPDLSYLFEIIYPSNRIVVDYGAMEDLVLLAIINTKTGKDIEIASVHHISSIPFPVVKQLDGISEIKQVRAIQRDNEEGFVIRFASGLRVKVKMDEYLRLHRLVTQVTARTIWELLKDGKSIDELLEHVPDEFYHWVRGTAAELNAYARHIYSEAFVRYGNAKLLPTRKEQAEYVKLAPDLAPIVFKMLDGKDTHEIIWKQIRPAAERPFRTDEP